MIRKGDLVTYRLASGRPRELLVTGTAMESGFPVFDGIVLQGHERGQEFWGYDSQVISSKRCNGVDMLVTFRWGAIVLDRIRVQANTDEMAIERARAIAVSRALVNGRGIPDLNDATVTVLVENQESEEEVPALEIEDDDDWQEAQERAEEMHLDHMQDQEWGK